MDSKLVMAHGLLIDPRALRWAWSAGAARGGEGCFGRENEERKNEIWDFCLGGAARRGGEKCSAGFVGGLFPSPQASQL
jgi:hypothetical protein